MNLAQSEAHFEMGDSGKKSPKLDDLAVSQIGRKLRSEFDEVLKEPVPDRFKALLDKLDDAEKSTGKAKRNG